MCLLLRLVVLFEILCSVMTHACAAPGSVRTWVQWCVLVHSVIHVGDTAFHAACVCATLFRVTCVRDRG